VAALFVVATASMTHPRTQSSVFRRVEVIEFDVLMSEDGPHGPVKVGRLFLV
jgi:hypothetical protein